MNTLFPILLRTISVIVPAACIFTPYLDCELLSVEKNLVDVVWGEGQPKKISNPIVTLGLEFTGKAVCEKWTDIKEKMAELKISAVVITALDEIACNLNLKLISNRYLRIFI